MALSDEEQRLLDQLEATLRAEDPKLAHTLGAAKAPKLSGPRVVIAAIAFVAGIAALIMGIQLGWPISVVGFVLMFGSVALILISRPKLTDGPAPVNDTPQGGSFMGRMEDRWNRRQGGVS
jgi:hypothetical protein